MAKQKVFVTGATGGMGFESLKQMLLVPTNRTLSFLQGIPKKIINY